MSGEAVVQILVSGIAVGGIYVLVAQGFYITWRTSVTLNFGQGDFLMLGAFVALTGLRMGLPVVAAVAVVVGVLALLGVVLQRVAVQPVLKAGHGALTWAFTTLGVGVILQNTAILLWGMTGYDAFRSAVRTVDGPIDLTASNWAWQPERLVVVKSGS